MNQSISTQVLALSAICLAVRAVQQVARGEALEPGVLQILLQSIAEQNPAEAVDIYGGKLANLAGGYHILAAQLGDQPRKDLELTRYVMAVLVLERLLNKSKDSLGAVGKRIERLQQQLQHFQVTDDNIIASIADIYVEHISPLGNRIQIAGVPEQLKQSAVQQKIRALLLAAVRSAVLWRQAGGRRYHFLFQRKALLRETQQVLQQLA